MLTISSQSHSFPLLYTSLAPRTSRSPPVCSESHGKLTVFSMKAMLATMCGGKIVDKLRCESQRSHSYM